MQTVRVATAFHDTARLLVDNLYLVVHDHVLGVFLEQCIGLEQLIHRVYAFAFHTVVAHDFVLLCCSFFGRTFEVFQRAKLSGDIRHYKEVLCRAL